MLSAPADHSRQLRVCESQVFSVSCRTYAVARRAALQIYMRPYSPEKHKDAGPWATSSQVIVTQPRWLLHQSREPARSDVESYEGLSTAVNAQSAWPVLFAFCFLRAISLFYVRAVAFDRGMFAK